MTSKTIALIVIIAALSMGAAHAAVVEQDDERAAALERIRALHGRLLLAPRDSYLNYAIATIARREKIDLKEEGIKFPVVPVVTDDPARRVDLFGLATGALAVHESLQLTELVGPARRSSGATVPLADLDPPDLPLHDFGDVPELEGGGALDDGARLVPADWIFMRFKNGRELLAALREADQWIKHGLVFYGGGGRDAERVWPLFGHLGLPDPRLLPVLYEALPGPIFVTASDPFLREGTDVTVILPRDIPPRFLGADQEGGGGGTERSLRHAAQVDGRAVVSTSRRALDAVLATAAGSRPSMAASAEFRAMRRLVPGGEDEAVFAFLSDTFMRRLVSARLRILESRRVRCASHLRTMVNAALLFREDQGRPAASIEDLVEGGYLKEATLRCPQVGAYSLEDGLAARCTVHNRLGALTPHIDLDLTEVSEEEASAYRRFARAYTNFWRRYFDPAAISVSRSERSFIAELLVLPLAQSSIYRNLAAFAGGAPLESGAGPVAPSAVVLLAGKVDRAFARDLEDWFDGAGLLPPDTEPRGLLDGFGGTATLGLLDDRLLFGFDITGFMGEAVRWNRQQDVLLAALIGGANLPAYAAIPVRDRGRAESFLDTLRQGALLRGARPGGGRFTLKFDAFDLDRAGAEAAEGAESAEGAAGSAGAIRTLTLELFSFKFRLFYALSDGHLVVSTRPDVLQFVMESAEPDPGEIPFNVKLALYPGHWDAIAPDMLISYEEQARSSCRLSLMEMQPFAGLGLDSAARALGFAFRCPDGGTCGLGADGFLECTLHGSPARPRQPAAPAAANPVSRLLDGLEEISFSLRFEGDGIRSTIRIER